MAVAFYGPTKQAAEKTHPLKGTGFSPYVSHQKQERLYRLRKNALYEGHGFSRAVNVLRGGGFSR